MACRWLVALVVAAATAPQAQGIDNGFGWASPPMGWRSWNQFSTQINQTLIEATYEAMVKQRPGLSVPSPSPGGGAGGSTAPAMTSLLELGYR